MPWRALADGNLVPKGKPENSALLKGVFDNERIHQPLRYFVVCGDTGTG